MRRRLFLKPTVKYKKEMFQEFCGQFCPSQLCFGEGGEAGGWCAKVLRLNLRTVGIRNISLVSLPSVERPLDVSAAMVVVMVVHVLHRDPAPHPDHKRFDLALVFAASDAEVAVLTPVLSPGVGSGLKEGTCHQTAAVTIKDCLRRAQLDQKHFLSIAFMFSYLKKSMNHSSSKLVSTYWDF